MYNCKCSVYIYTHIHVHMFILMVFSDVKPDTKLPMSYIAAVHCKDSTVVSMTSLTTANFIDLKN